ncbi:hypothetical protein [Deinococcus sp.]|uniref:hypothetical protein n=1 Tax=Deinococcus sp. TaxID=47478 RepID=UPI0025F26459|nr:hypothetical protein [Deinococcus sp.]
MKAPLKLSSEMRLLLAALVLVALVGGWYTWNNRTTSGQTVAPPVTAPLTPTAPKPSATKPSTVKPGTTAPVSPSAQVKPPAASAGKPSAAGTVTPARPTTVLTIPPLSNAASKPGAKPGTAATIVTETDAEVQRPPAGINPATPLAAVPVVNPFSPLKVVGDANSNPAPVPASARAPQQQVRSGPSVAFTPQVRTGGVIPSTPIPVAEVSAPSGGPRLGGILPAPSINSGAQAALDQKQALAEQAKAQQIAQADAKRAEAEQKAAADKLAAAQKAEATKATIAKAKADLLAAQQAKRAADIAAAQAVARARASTSAPVGVSAAANTPAPSTSSAASVAVTPDTNAAVGSVQPGVITQLGNPGAATSTPAPSTVLNTLDRYLQERNLSFDSVVLGPLNTAIFKTDRGLVVVSVGQNIPDTNIAVREVTASSVTLALDTNTKILQLEKR